MINLSFLRNLVNPSVRSQCLLFFLIFLNSQFCSKDHSSFRKGKVILRDFVWFINKMDKSNDFQVTD